MKILQISTSTFADPRYYRSNEYTLCLALAKLGHEVTLFTSDKHPSWQYRDNRQVQRVVESVDGFAIRRFPSGPELDYLPSMPTLLFELMKGDFDVFHAHAINTPSSTYSALASRFRKKPLVVTQHDYLYGGGHGLRLFFRMANNYALGPFTIHTAKALIGLSSEAVSFLKRFGVRSDKIKMIPNSVDTTLFRPDRYNLLLERRGIERPAVLFVGRLTKSKAVDVLLRAFGKVASKVPNAKLVIVGSGAEEKNLKALSNEIGLSQVYFLGRVPKEEMPSVYASCDLLVLPSLYEPFGNVVIEAMASGLPVIGSGLGGIMDTIVHGVTGYHVKPADVDQLADYLQRLLVDERLRVRMSQASRQMATDRFDDRIIALEIERIYRNCLEHRSPYS